MERARNTSRPSKLITLGDHIRNERVKRRLFQRTVADFIGVCEDSITHWESNYSQPQIKHYPAIFSFLGYYPFSNDGNSVEGKLRQLRLCQGKTYVSFGLFLKADPRNISDWEQGRKALSSQREKQIVELWGQLPQYLKQQYRHE